MSVGVCLRVYMYGARSVCGGGIHMEGGYLGPCLSGWVCTSAWYCSVAGVCVCGAVAVGEYWCVWLHLWGVDM